MQVNSNLSNISPYSLVCATDRKEINMTYIRNLFACLALSSVSIGSFASQPLSCEVLMLLTGFTAVERDNGISRTNTAVAKNKEKELTKKEIKFILDAVYIVGENQTPDQIKNQMYGVCRDAQR